MHGIDNWLTAFTNATGPQLIASQLNNRNAPLQMQVITKECRYGPDICSDHDLGVVGQYNIDMQQYLAEGTITYLDLLAESPLPPWLEALTTTAGILFKIADIVHPPDRVIQFVIENINTHNCSTQIVEYRGGSVLDRSAFTDTSCTFVI